jgi:hypothetical protein
MTVPLVSENVTFTLPFISCECKGANGYGGKIPIDKGFIGDLE